MAPSEEAGAAAAAAAPEPAHEGPRPAKGDKLLQVVVADPGDGAVAADIDTEVASDGALTGFKRLGGTDHVASQADSIGSSPSHGYQWRRGDVLD